LKRIFKQKDPNQPKTKEGFFKRVFKKKGATSKVKNSTDKKKDKLRGN
jgi:hypothetical protein